MKSIHGDTQRELAAYYRYRLADPAARMALSSEVTHDYRVRGLEDDWLEQELRQIDLASLPTGREEFLAWYLQREKQMNVDILPFVAFLEEKASVEQVAFYICMEEMIDGSFDDMMAVVQVGMPVECKMVAARNYWDELGNGDFTKVHTTMFRESSSYLRSVLEDRSITIDRPPTECLMNGNVLLTFTFRPEYRLRLIGAIGLVEGSAPRRFRATTRAMQRLNLPANVIAYHKSHITIDTKHSKEWFDTVLHHYANQGSDVIREMALGVLIRYQVALKYYRFMLESMQNLTKGMECSPA